ncbi:MAG: hypothetical protein Q9184_005464 [Pyrenodesmia sp. 2 TL-2023]
MNTVLTLPSTAKKLVYEVESQTFHFYTSSPLPTPDYSKDDHLILVKATALCNRELVWPTLFPEAIFSENPERQIVPGYDVAGVVLSSPPQSRFRQGDEIIARTRPNRPGNCREYGICRSEEMAPKPQNLSWAEAASIPVSALTAWQALFEHAGVQGFQDPSFEGKRVLIIAAAGSVGVWLVQLAKMAGLRVIAQVGSPENGELVKDLGATEVINYRTTSLKDWAAHHEPVDVVFDLLGRESLGDAWYCVKDHGSLISIVEPPEERVPADFRGKGVKSNFFILSPNSRQLKEISKMANDGRCITLVDSIWKLEEYEEAFARMTGGHARGKVVIQISE